MVHYCSIFSEKDIFVSQDQDIHPAVETGFRNGHGHSDFPGFIPAFF